MTGGTTRGILKAAGFVMFAIFISRILGFVREMAITRVFGRGFITDAFYAAFAIPDLMYFLLVGGAISSAFIPVFTSYLAKEREDKGWEVASTFINITVILLLSFTILGIIFAPIFAPLVAYAFEGEQRQILINLMRIMFPAVLFTALAGLEMGILHSYKFFITPAIGPILYNVAIILAVLIAGPRFGITGVAVGVVVGALSSFLLQLPFVLKRSKYKFILNLRHPGIIRMVALMVPSIIGLSIQQINLIVNQNMASGLTGGDITALRLANRLALLPMGIFAMGITTAVFPTLTRQVATDKIGEFKDTLSMGIRTVFFITIPSAVGLIVLRVPIIRLLFERGEFTSTDTIATAYALLFYSFGLVAQSGVQVTTRAYYALQDTLTPVKIGFATVALNIVLNIVFLQFTGLNHGGLAFANSIAMSINMVVLFIILRQKVNGMRGKEIALSFIKAVIMSILMGAAIYLLLDYTGDLLNVERTLDKILEVGVLIVLGIGIYGGGSLLLNMEEAHMILKIVKERLKGKKKISA